MKKKLPFEKESLLQMYQYTAFPFGIIQGNAQCDITPWLCSKVINCMFDPTDASNKFHNCFSDPWMTRDKILIEQKITLSKEMYDFLHIDLLDFFRQMICRGNYITGKFNEGFIPGKKFYGKAYYSHGFLLTGFDTSKKVFYAAGYLKDNHFQEYEIPFQNLEASICSLKDEIISFSFFSFNKEAEFRLDIPNVIEEINCYLESRVQVNSNKNCSYGVKALEQLCILIATEAEKWNSVDIRYTRGVMEREYIMQKRMEFFTNNNFEIIEEDLKAALICYDLSKKIHLLGIKYNLTHKPELVTSIQNLLSEIISIEKKYLPKVVVALRKQQKKSERL